MTTGKEKEKKEATLTTCMITQDLLKEHWNWQPPESDYLKNNADDTPNIQAIGQTIVNKLTTVGIVVIEFYIILHDKCVQKKWEETLGDYIQTCKADHIHGVLKFSTGGTLAQIAAAIGLKPEFVEKPKSGRYAYNNMLSYLIHIKEPNKHQYDPCEVISVLGNNYMNIYHDNKLDWEKGRAKVQGQKARTDIDWLEEMLLKGMVTKQQIMLTDEYYEVYSRNKRQCEDALDTYAQRKAYRTIQAMQRGEFLQTVIYITGKPRSGKSFLCDRLTDYIRYCVKLSTKEDWRSHSCAATNPYDNYQGEEILVMDDLRGTSLTASDWLRLLDPERISYGSARYNNKQIACRVIIINAYKPPLDFFYYLKNIGGGDRSESLDQFFDRITMQLTVTKAKTGERYVDVSESHETDAYCLPIVNKHNAYGNDEYTQLVLRYKFYDLYNNLSIPNVIPYLAQMVLYRNKMRYPESMPLLDCSGKLLG